MRLALELVLLAVLSAMIIFLTHGVWELQDRVKVLEQHDAATYKAVIDLYLQNIGGA